MRSLVWLRNDLRQLDNPALHHACLVSDEVVAVYLITEKQWKDHDDAQCKISFWLRALASLKKSLHKLKFGFRGCEEILDCSPLCADSVI